LVNQYESRTFARVYSEPVAKIDRLRYLLLLWPEKPAAIFAPKPAAKLDDKKIVKPAKKDGNSAG